MLGKISSLASNIMAALHGPSVIIDSVDDSRRLHPVRLAMAARMYWFQSQILGIPDRFGFMAPPHLPRIQVEECGPWVALAIVYIHMFYLEAGALLLCYYNPKLSRKSVAGLGFLLTMMPVTLLGMIWAKTCSGPQREPGYVWKDWKERTD
ncbi:hypothetical protein QBC35DRAFT_471964 [Podospora australis]|uniref:Uncharacterized protein n=1 Tax=Podospora australis TaxID=1536484 RepID=A0AAN6WY36_9PEZI|nr:hypothetical protein QBC35DRAFT_471964 [Podospora australis]